MTFLRRSLFALAALCAGASGSLANPVVATADPAAPNETTIAPAVPSPSVTSPAASDASPAASEPARAAGPSKILNVAAAAAFATRPVFVAAKVGDPPPPPKATLFADINLTTQSVTIRDTGGVLYTWPISSGTASHPTETGTYRGKWSAKMWYSRKYGWAPMPHAVFFNEGTAMHATYATGMLGQPASHGCIRLSPANAKLFFNLVQKHGVRATEFTVFGKPKFPAYVARATPPRQRIVPRPQTETLWGSFFGYADDPPSPAQLRAERRRQAQQRAAAGSAQRRAPRATSTSIW